MRRESAGALRAPARPRFRKQHKMRGRRTIGDARMLSPPRPVSFSHTGATAADACLLAHAHILGGAPRRALAALAPAGGPTSPDPAVAHLAARALAGAGDWEGVLDCLGGPGGRPAPASPLPTGAPPDLVADAWTLRGTAHAALDDRAAAAAAFRAALAADPAAVGALHALVDGHLLAPGEEAALVAGLGYAPGDEWLQVRGRRRERERERARFFYQPPSLAHPSIPSIHPPPFFF